MGMIIDSKGYENQLAVLSALSTVDGELGKRLRECIFEELKAARDRIVSDITFKNGDPRGTAKAVKRYVARKYLGGVVSILDGKGSGGVSNYEAPRKVYPGPGGQRGGNRMLRSQRTQEILNYAGVDRGFILRFVNSGTNPRYSGGGRVELGKSSSAKNFFRMQEEGTGYRGSIAPRNFFGTAGSREMQRAVENLGRMIDEEYDKIFKN